MKILKKEILAENSGIKITKLEILSPELAKKAKAGQFVALMVSEKGERIPLTIVDSNQAEGIITLIFQEAGLTTKLLGKMNIGDSLYSLTGPLGHATEIKNYGRVILVGGGVGIAEIYPVAKALKKAGNHVSAILGARNKDFLILEPEMKAVCDELLVVTDDGSYSRKGFTTDILDELLKKGGYDLVYAVGPIPMMRKAAGVTKNYNIKTIVSLNALMVDATGMCGGCRVNVAGKTKFSCVDGPEFDAAMVDWEALDKRNKIYKEQEKHICNLYKL
ncbi:MAG: sulfide/dihydroorotate dehydrogenase-like FAD/NAD-binding protein [Candidatus Omnitrophica bacterium]|jgi:ferredoxin--NADP+ reductase|nr:sulfide/dihydroorotate dehydrogenase-like FAD/NAD-binding protein [Candidatus Omnitrophota bacterium]